MLPQFILADGLSFAVTPTIFDMAAAPGQTWDSSINVVNNNPYELTVYASVVNFKPEGEQGHGTFVPILNEQKDGTTLAEWITVSSDPITIQKEQSVAVPLHIAIPSDATPGGHYAAVMIGTRPAEKDGKLEVKTAQIITSLFFVRIAGDVIEKGEVRTFRPTSWFAGKPEMSFEVRFENKGNVHLQPQGEIVIKNMWGKERGIIPINHETHFGNVLPESVRQFDFLWKGESSLTDIGRYTANLTLAYGDKEVKFTTRSAAFWVIPVKPVLVFVLSFVFATWFITRTVRAYVRYMLRMSGINPDVHVSKQRTGYQPHTGDVRIERKVSVRAPVVAGVVDLKRRLEAAKAFLDTGAILWSFVRSYKTFFLSAVVCIVIFTGAFWYVTTVLTEQRDYEVVIDNNEHPVTLSSEQIMHDRKDQTTAPEAHPEVVSASTSTQAFSLSIVNASETPGQGGVLADQLTAGGYTVDTLSAALEDEKKNSVIVFDPSLEKEALALAQIMKGALLSAFPPENSDHKPQITIYIGNDYSAE